MHATPTTTNTLTLVHAQLFRQCSNDFAMKLLQAIQNLENFIQFDGNQKSSSAGCDGQPLPAGWGWHDFPESLFTQTARTITSCSYGEISQCLFVPARQFVNTTKAVVPEAHNNAKRLKILCVYALIALQSWRLHPPILTPLAHLLLTSPSRFLNACDVIRYLD